MKISTISFDFKANNTEQFVACGCNAGQFGEGQYNPGEYAAGGCCENCFVFATISLR